MPIAQFDLLNALIQSLDRSEKRYFKLYVNRLESNEDGLFLKLFDLIEQASSPDEDRIFKKMQLKTVNQFSNLKRHLYSQIIKSLRLKHIRNSPAIKIREYLDYAHVLYGKGLFRQSLLLLEKAREWALESDKTLIYLEVLELQKKIESRHITRSRKHKNQIEKLISDSIAMRNQVTQTSELSDLSLSMQGLYINFGFAKNDRDAAMINTFYSSHQPAFDPESSSFYTRVLWYQSNVWYHYMLLDFQESKRYALKWIEAFEQTPLSIESDPDLYMRGMHYFLTCTFYLSERHNFKIILDKYSQFRKANYSKMNTNSKVVDFQYYQNAKINACILFKNYSDTEMLETSVLDEIDKFREHLDYHRIQVYHYKIALLHFYQGNYDKALDYCNRILSTESEILKPDMFCYTRLVHLFCLFSLNNFDVVETMNASVRNSFMTHMQTNEWIESIFSFLRKACRAMNFGLKDEIRNLLDKLENQKESSYAKVSLIYFDFESWLWSLYKNTTIEKI